MYHGHALRSCARDGWSHKTVKFPYILPFTTGRELVSADNRLPTLYRINSIHTNEVALYNEIDELKT